jgi:protein ImuB
MTLADARALVPELTVADAEPRADGEALGRLTNWCGRYSPWCATDGDDGIRLEITGCAHLFGGEMAMVRDITQRVKAFGLTVRGGIADTPAAAWGWARHRPNRKSPILETGETESLLSLPIAALRLDQDNIDILRVLGLGCIGEVAALPRGPLSQRLGAGVLQRLDRIFGRVAEPISPRPIAEPWISRLIFAEAIGRREDIDLATARLVDHLCGQMLDKGQGARRLVLGFYRVDGGFQHIAIGTSSPSHMPVHIIRLFSERLDMVEPGFGIEAMVLEATETEPLSPQQSTFSTANAIDATALAGLVDRLQNRLGTNRVVQLAPVQSYVPERAEIRVPALSVVSEQPNSYRNSFPSRNQEPEFSKKLLKPKSFESSPLKSVRPLILLPVPQPIEAIAPVPDDPPLSFRWRRIQHRITAADGPERIGPEWWLRARGKPRDYYRVEDVAGRRYWLYREGLYGAAEPPLWFLHGFFP